ncbi:MAG: DNA repair protein RecO [Armatimonadetes bacterium]|nr:DNA repair protein RecO [Armatimonadota bacterium]
MPTYNATGITLGAHKYGDAARVVTFFTRERGKVEATARGIGKPGSKLAAAVEPFTLSRLQFAEGRDLDRLTQAEVLQGYVPLRQDMRRYAYGAALLELTALTTEPGQAVPDLFEALVAALAALAGATDLELIFWAYTLRLLQTQGNAPEIEHCVHCGARITGQVWHLAVEGGFVCRDCSPQSNGRAQVSGAAVGALRGLVTLPFDRLDRLSLSQGVRREVGRVIRAHLSYHVSGELRSLAFLDKVSRAKGRSDADLS